MYYYIVNVLDKMIGFATEAHKGQKRKFTNEDYITHPIKVMELVRQYNSDEKVWAAAVGHDLIEDTSVTILDIEREFGLGIAMMVFQVTSPSKEFPHLSRPDRKSMDRYQLSVASADSQDIKYCDIFINVPDMVANNPDKEFSKQYVLEKMADMHVMTIGNQDLYHKVKTMLYSYGYSL